MESQVHGPSISLMIAVPNAPAAVDWYKRALGATVLWSLGSVAGLEIEGAPFFLAEPARNAWNSPAEIGTTTVRVELFCDDPDALIKRALEQGATGSLDNLKDHQRPWGIHRQGSFTDPFGHIWFVGDKSPLKPFPL
jgi:PhnB protein